MFLYLLVYFFHVYSTIKEESKKYLFDMPMMIMATMMTMLMTYLVSLWTPWRWFLFTTGTYLLGVF